MCESTLLHARCIPCQGGQCTTGIFIAVPHIQLGTVCVGSELEEHTKNTDSLGSADWMIRRQTTNQIHSIAKPISIGGSDYTPTPISLVGWDNEGCGVFSQQEQYLSAHRKNRKLWIEMHVPQPQVQPARSTLGIWRKVLYASPLSEELYYWREHNLC